MKTYFATFNYFEIELPEDVVRVCNHSGPCDADVENSRMLPEVTAELNKLDPEKLKNELREYGAWDAEELSNHDENLNRILWIAAGDVQDNNEEWLQDHPLAN